MTKYLNSLCLCDLGALGEINKRLAKRAKNAKLLLGMPAALVS
jgi:hypothetical protein